MDRGSEIGGGPQVCWEDGGQEGSQVNKLEHIQVVVIWEPTLEDRLIDTTENITFP